MLEPIVGARFRSMREATNFTSDYSFTKGQHTKKAVGGSVKQATYVCADKACSRSIKVLRESSRTESRAYLITHVVDVHADTCTSFAKPTQWKLGLLPTYTAAVATNKTIKMKEVTHLLQDRDGVCAQGRHSAVYRAIAAAADASEMEWETSFGVISLNLRSFRASNAHFKVEVAEDQHDRFYRPFTALGIGTDSIGSRLRMLGFDGAYIKHKQFSGVVLSLVGQDGNNNNHPLAYAIVDKETPTTWLGT